MIGTIIKDSDYPKNRFISKATITEPLSHHIPLGELIMLAKRDLSRRIAETISDTHGHFEVRSYRYGGLEMTDITLDAIVLTESEYIDLMKKQFTRGMEHARGFMHYE